MPPVRIGGAEAHSLSPLLHITLSKEGHQTATIPESGDYMRDLIRRNQAWVEVIATLQSAINEGVQSGDPRPMDTAKFLLRMRGQHGR